MLATNQCWTIEFEREQGQMRSLSPVERVHAEVSRVSGVLQSRFGHFRGLDHPLLGEIGNPHTG